MIQKSWEDHESSLCPSTFLTVKDLGLNPEKYEIDIYYNFHFWQVKQPYWAIIFNCTYYMKIRLNYYKFNRVLSVFDKINVL